MSTRLRKPRLAPSFVVSLALLPACGSGSGDPRDPGDCRPPECHMNPPPPPEPPPTATPTAAASGSPTAPVILANPPPPMPAQPPAPPK